MKTRTHIGTPRVLVIENDFMIADMIEDMVSDLGYVVTRTAHRYLSALDELRKENFDGALVNIGIDQERHGTQIADMLIALGIPFGFVTGYAHALEDRHGSVPLLAKPFTQEQLRALLVMLVGPSSAPPKASDAA